VSVNKRKSLLIHPSQEKSVRAMDGFHNEPGKDGKIGWYIDSAIGPVNIIVSKIWEFSDSPVNKKIKLQHSPMKNRNKISLPFKLTHTVE
jgi:hypothetical protein